ncbi:MAG: phytoene desaturase [Flavobacterium sp.]|nr:phytoene desaturase [Flavobacterium sp.]
MNIRPKVVVIGAGFSGLSAASVLAQHGYDVKILEKHHTTGGRARVFRKDGFKFDMGPSWYWMPEVMEQFFNRFGKSAADYFELKRLDPSYQVIFSREDIVEVPADMSALLALFESKEPGGAAKLQWFLQDAQEKYEIAMGSFVNKPALSVMEFANVNMLRLAVRMNLFSSFSKHVRSHFKSAELQQILEFPVLFLGARPADIPAMYSMMNYADLALGTWYPMGGFGELPDAMVKVATEQGAVLHLDANVQSLLIEGGKVVGVKTNKEVFEADFVISSADYHFTETLLPKPYRNYSEKYWNDRVMAPSCLLYYLGIDKKIAKLQHHNLFFEGGFNEHADSIYTKPSFPTNPLYYVCCPGKTDTSVAPEGKENIFMLIPVAPGLDDTPEIRKKYYQETMARLEDFCGEPIADHVVSYTDYAGSDFVTDYNAFKGNAYGLANTLRQTAVLKPKIKNKKLDNLYYTGQLTVPGPGVPPSIISGQIVADYIINNSKQQKK